MLHLIAATLLTFVPIRGIDDRAVIITPTERAELAQYIDTVSTQQGIDLVLVTLPALGNETPKVAASRIGAEHGLTPRAIVILVSMNPRTIWIQPGGDFREQLSGPKATEVVRTAMVPDAKAGLFGRAAQRGFEACVRLVSMVPALTAPVVMPTDVPVPVTGPSPVYHASWADEHLGLIVMLVIVGLFLLIWLWGWLGSRESRRVVDRAWGERKLPRDDGGDCVDDSFTSGYIAGAMDSQPTYAAAPVPRPAPVIFVRDNEPDTYVPPSYSPPRHTHSAPASDPAPSWTSDTSSSSSSSSWDSGSSGGGSDFGGGDSGGGGGDF